MTVVTADFPDWGRTVARSTRLLSKEDNVDCGVTQVRGPFFVGDMPYIGIYFRNDTGGGDIELEFFLDKAMTVKLSDVRVNLDTGVEWDQSVPVYGPWMQFSAAEVSPDFVIDWILWMTDADGSPQRTSSERNRLISTAVAGQAIAAGATTVLTANRVYIGEAHWHVSADATPWDALLRTQGPGIAQRLIDRTESVERVFSKRVFLTGQRSAIAMHNGSGAVATFWATLFHKPLQGG